MTMFNTRIQWKTKNFICPVQFDGELLDYFYSITKPTSSKIAKYLNL